MVSFNNTDGSLEDGTLITDSAGNLFGTTLAGGVYGDGTVFEIAKTSTGYASAPTTLVSFNDTTASEGAAPSGGLIADAAGDLFGTTESGGVYGDGTVFELVNDSGGSYSLNTLVSFNTTDGNGPTSTLIADAAGNLFGTTSNGGEYGDGTVFELVNHGGGSYSLNTLVSFNGADGGGPVTSLMANADGDLFGTTDRGGANNYGTVFELSGTGFQPICFMAGTSIRTPGGEVAVEMLKRGDLILTRDGRTMSVSWIGRQTISTRFGDPLRVLPIRFIAGALAENVPSRDLLVSPDHAILVGDVLIQAGALVNGTSVRRETNVPQTFTYYHVELDDHSLILAENTPAETFVDNVDRLAFDNWEEYEVLFPEGKPIVEMPYPRAKAHRQVPRAIREHLAARAAILAMGEAQDVAA